MNRRLNRSLYRLALENEEVVVDDATAAPREAAAAAPAGETAIASTDNVDVTVKEGEAGKPTTVVVEVDTAAAAAAEAPADVAEVAAEDLTVIEDGESIAEDLVAADEVAIDSAELLDEVQQADDAVVVLEAYAEQLHIAAQNGGINDQSARFMMIGVESIYDRLGLGKPLGVPALESFALQGARPGATTIALEDIKESIKKVWDMIVAGIKKAVEWLAEFAKRVFTANGRLKARAEKLKAAAESSADAFKGEEIANKSLVKALAIGSSVPSNLVAEIGKLNAFAVETIGDRTLRGLRTVATAIKAADPSKGPAAGGSVDEINAAVREIAGKGLKAGGYSAKGLAAAPEGTTLNASPVFPGNQVVYAYVPDSVAAVGKFRAGAHTEAVSTGDKVKGVSAADAKSLCDLALDYVKDSARYDAIQKEVKSLSETLAKRLTDLSRSVNLGAVGSANKGEGVVDKAKDIAGNVKDGVTAVTDAFRAARALVTGVHQPAFAIAAKANSAALDLVAASFKAKAKAEEKKEEKK